MRWISLITIFLLCACNAITGVDDLNFDGTSDTDTDTDIDTDTDTDTCVCTTGDCCDGCEYFPSTTQCSATPENTARAAIAARMPRFEISIVTVPEHPTHAARAIFSGISGRQ